MTKATDIAAIANTVVGWARNGEALEVYVSRGTETEVSVYEGEIESLSSATSAGIGIRVITGGRQGFAYSGSLDEHLWKETLEEARDNASFATPDEGVGLPAPDGVKPAELDLWRDDLGVMPVERKVAMALELEKAVRAADPRIRQVESAEWGDSLSETAIASSLGVSGRSRSTVCYLAASAVAAEGDDVQTAAGYTVGRSPEDLDPSKAVRDAVEHSTRLLGATKPRSTRLTVVFEPKVTASLLSIIAGTLDGEAVLKGRSLFADRIGEQVGAAGLDLVDDPTNPLAWGASAFDAEGLASRRNVLLSGGVLQKFLYDATSARRAGTVSTASAIRGGYKSAPFVGARAVLLSASSDLTSTPEEILAKVGDGLLVQSVSGLHSGVNTVSGDFSVGAEGLMIKGGTIGAPVRGLTIASTLQRMLQGIIAVGSDVEFLPSNAAGLTLAIEDLSISGE